MTRRLFERFPRAATAIPWVELATLPTPIDMITLPATKDAPAIPVRVKRDDLSGDAYGGNKVRKLEFLLAAARARGETRVITAGAFGSHHALATTVYARRLGFDVTTILFPQHVTPHVREVVLMCAAMGAEVRYTPRMEGVPFALWRAALEARGRACIIPPGGSDAVGTLGYVEAGLELAAQWQNGDTARPERIHLAAGTLGTTAGLAAGLAIAGENVTLAATRITSRLVTNDRNLLGLVRGVLEILAPYATASLPDAETVARTAMLLHDQVGDGYGRATDAGDNATRRFAAAGIVLDATYTAKSAAALLADPGTQAGETLFLHTLSAVAPITPTDIVSEDALPPQITARLARTSE